MGPMLGWTLMVLAGGLQYVSGSEDTAPLFLTPLIKMHQYDIAKEKSKVPLFKQHNINAHSGYITVNESTKNHLFFLLVLAEGDSPTTPLLLWTQGGPGLSALFGQFLENGPLAFDARSGSLTKRANTLQKGVNIIYLDLPVGAGFSFTEMEAYPTGLDDINRTVMEFLRQFLELFSEFKDREFYLAGESYGARYSVAAADWLLKHEKNVSVNLKGVIGGNGFLGPIFDIADSSDFLYEMSMLDGQGRTQFLQRFQLARDLSEYSSNTTVAVMRVNLLFNTIFVRDDHPTLFQTLTLYNDHASPLYTERPLQLIKCYLFLNGSSELRQAMHVGHNTTFQYSNPRLFDSLIFDWLRDTTNLLENVLNNTRVLLYTGQIDALFPSVNQRAYFRTLNWSESAEYKNATRVPWKPYIGYNGNAGYVKRTTNFTEAVILGMSHYGAAEKPDEVYFLIKEFMGIRNAADNCK